MPLSTFEYAFGAVLLFFFPNLIYNTMLKQFLFLLSLSPFYIVRAADFLKQIYSLQGRTMHNIEFMLFI